uniref:Tripartite motif-containing protein 2 n=1 Tax=Magallana gigas TaxID=29159 RepID=K1Q2G7_MAGGI
MSKQGEQWHREIDIVINKMKTEIKEIKVKHKDILKKHLDEIKQMQALMKQTLLAIKYIEKSTETIKTKSAKRPSGIAVDCNGDLLYSDGLTRTLNKIKNGQTEELIRLQGWIPGQLCVTSTGDLLVAMLSDVETQSKVARYSVSTEKQTIQFDGEGNSPYSGNNKIKYITENRNHDICVADSVAGAVVVVNWNSELRYKYTGYSSDDNPFNPRGITTDSQGRILTAYFDNHCIHILDQDGQFLHYIDNCGLQSPLGICVDIEDNMFVCERNNGNEKIKYISENRNHDICVADSVASAVVVVNRDGKLGYRYTGHPSITKNKPFKPRGITTDSQSHILTANRDNHCIHILDQNGQFLCFIDNCDLQNPLGICVDIEDNLFVCEYYNVNVKKIKYLK